MQICLGAGSFRVRKSPELREICSGYGGLSRAIEGIARASKNRDGLIGMELTHGAII
jgi:hypothetical protein